ncbi:head-tail connector protein [Paracoccus sp. NGMCC 1.201697]|uniref:Head-tail connector protein n=1 Tax=Paracoccus broussonetiae subsp. drimophilus TaxID=3373869 RepID=A0ABW7LJM2_9RHOB
MAQLVDLPTVRNYLRISAEDDDTNLAFLIEVASGAVINYLKSAADAWIGDDGEVLPDVEIPAEVQGAVVYLVGVLVRNPDNDAEGAWQQGFLPMPVTAMLYPLRDPACA